MPPWGAAGWRFLVWLNDAQRFRVPAVKPLAECRLYAVVDTAFLRGRPPETVAQALVDGGADLIQLRAKNAADETIRRLAEAVLPVTERAGIGLIINDHPAIARAVGAPGCHLGQTDFFGAGHVRVAELSEPGSRWWVGLSSSAPAYAERAVAAGADYLGVGPVFPTRTKPDAPPTSLEYVRWAAAHLELPWFAIGGINLDTLEAVLAAGARRVCVISALLNAPDLAQACQQFKERLG